MMQWIPANFAEAPAFNQNVLPRLNYHRHCLFTQAAHRQGQGSQHVSGQRDCDALRKLKSLPDAGRYLETGMAFETWMQWLFG
jgi:hypothetical protein